MNNYSNACILYNKLWNFLRIICNHLHLNSIFPVYLMHLSIGCNLNGSMLRFKKIFKDKTNIRSHIYKESRLKMNWNIN